MVLKFYKKNFDNHNVHPLKIEIKNQIPMCSGVYFITEILLGEEVIVYVGSSIYLRQRLYSHPLVISLRRKGVYGGMYVIPYSEQQDYKYLEKAFIFELKPLYNKAGLNTDPYLEFKKSLNNYIKT